MSVITEYTLVPTSAAQVPAHLIYSRQLSTVEELHMFSMTLYVLLVAYAHNIHTHSFQFCQVHAKPKLDSTALVKYVKGFNSVVLV